MVVDQLFVDEMREEKVLVVVVVVVVLVLVPVLVLFFFFFAISLTDGASRLMEAQMNLLCLLFGVGFRIFIVTPRMFTFSFEYVKNV